MNLTRTQMDEIHKVQLSLFKQFVNICDTLKLKYYFVHGSLLGALRCGDFLPFDDDIDVAMPRKDYDVLIKKGSKLFSENIFLQSCETEEQYPLPFAKLRNSNTAFIQPNFKNLDINKGIYIDIFPIDYYPKNRISRFVCSFFYKLYSVRISSKLEYNSKQSFLKKSLRCLSKIIVPSFKFAIKKRAKLYENIKENENIIIVGGKISERGIPSQWFGDSSMLKFCGLNVKAPKYYKDYLNKIYGDYKSFDPSKKYMNQDGTVSVSAEIVSTTKSYKYLV